MRKNILKIFSSLAFLMVCFPFGAKSQNCIVSPTVNSVAFVSSTGGNCTYDINAQVTLNNSGTKWVYFNFNGGDIATATDNVCYRGTGVTGSGSNRIGNFTLDCSGTGVNSGTGSPVVSHTERITIPCGNTPVVSYAGSLDGGGSGANTCSPGTFSFAAFPVKLTSFTTKTVANGNLLQWATAEEINSEKFIVQRSQDALTFNDIYSVETGSNSNEPKRYSYLDESPVFGANYYRLKQIDIDGTITFSKMIVAIWEIESETLFPNPVINKEFVINGVSGEITRTLLSNVDGKAIPVEIKKNGNNVTARLSASTASGIYYLQIQTTDKLVSKKIVVQ